MRETSPLNTGRPAFGQHQPYRATTQNDTPQDPALLPQQQNSPYEYDHLQGQLFVDGVSETDVDQGLVGDCYFMAALASVAKSHPHVIEEMIKPVGKGQYQVSFYRFGKKVSVTVDADIPQYAHSNEPLYGESTQQNELWVSLVEKAYAVFKSQDHSASYSSIHGGNPATALYEITGVKAKTSHLNSFAGFKNSLYLKLARALRRGKPVVVDTKNDAALYNGTGLVADHAYSVLGMKRDENGQLYVELRNPWASHEWNGVGSDSMNDGIFKMPLNDFVKYFSHLYIGGTQ